MYTTSQINYLIFFFYDNRSDTIIYTTTIDLKGNCLVRPDGASKRSLIPAIKIAKLDDLATSVRPWNSSDNEVASM